jgi:hypothetical protein
MAQKATFCAMLCFFATFVVIFVRTWHCLPRTETMPSWERNRNPGPSSGVRIPNASTQLHGLVPLARKWNVGRYDNQTPTFKLHGQRPTLGRHGNTDNEIGQMMRVCRLLNDTAEILSCIMRAEQSAGRNRLRMQRVFELASLRVNRSWMLWPGFDYSDTRKQPIKVLAFSICVPGNASFNAATGSMVRKGSSAAEMTVLCNAQREGMHLWGQRNFITFRQVNDPLLIDEERSPHWQKLAYAHAFLQRDFDLIFFLDADCMVAHTKWDVRAYAAQKLPMASNKLWLFVDDTWDWHATGEFLIRKHPTSLSFLEDWYTLSSPFFNTTTPNAVLRTKKKGFDSDPLGDRMKMGSVWGQKPYAPAKRCDGRHVYHEQGCLGQFYAVAPRYLDNLAMVNANHLRRMFIHRHTQNPLIHLCCRTRKEQAAQMRQCIQKMKIHGSC